MTVRRRSATTAMLALMLGAWWRRPSRAQSAATSASAASEAAAGSRVVAITARRFRYEPNHIQLTRGEAVTLQFTSLDFVHGFSVPDWGLRADLPPGQLTEVKVRPDHAGTFAFLCDNFCGEGHEGMNGEFVVVEPAG